MILVLCGTQKQSFSRMIKAVETLADDNEIIVQAGHSQYHCEKMEIFDFIAPDKLKRLYEKTDFIITHAGAGSMFQAIESKKKIIAVPRMKKYGEHVDDHQLQLAEKLQKLGLLLVFNDGDNMRDIFDKLRGFEPKPYHLKGNIPVLIDQQLEKVFR